MWLQNLFRRAPRADSRGAGRHPAAQMDGGGDVLVALSEMIRFGVSPTATGIHVNVDRALKTPAMWRAVTLISNCIGMLPLHLIDAKTKEKQSDHPLYTVLHRRPNDWQTAFDFRALMQMRALVKGNAYALVVRGRDMRSGRGKVLGLVPLDPDLVSVDQDTSWRVTYRYQPRKGGSVTYNPQDILHLRGVTLDGLRGLSLVRQAGEAIGIALAAELATSRLLKNGTMTGGALELPDLLSPEAYDRLRASLAEKSGADNAGKLLILEQGAKFSAAGVSARDAQLDVLRKMQVEEIARVTGVPRPLLMMDETSWGSGIEALGQFFVTYALNPWFEAWQQACERTLLGDGERGNLAAKFNAGALLRGSMKDQAEVLAKALGSGGHAPWMHVDEVRDTMDLPEREAPPHTMMTGTTEAKGGR